MNLWHVLLVMQDIDYPCINTCTLSVGHLHIMVLLIFFQDYIHQPKILSSTDDFFWCYLSPVYVL